MSEELRLMAYAIESIACARHDAPKKQIKTSFKSYGADSPD